MQSLKPTIQQAGTKDVLPNPIAASTFGCHGNPVAGESSRDIQVEKGTSNTRHDTHDSISQPPALSYEQRTSFLRNGPADSEVGSTKNLPPSIDADDVLPDDSSLSYIGMPRDSTNVVEP